MGSRAMNRRRAFIGLCILLVVAAMTGPVVIALGADRGQAAFGDDETFGLNRLASASVAVEVGPNTVEINATAMAPGDQFTGSMVFENTGTLPLRYALVSEAQTGVVRLLDVLEWKIWPAPLSGTCGPAVGPFLFDGFIDGTQLLGDIAIGADPGDRLIQPLKQDLLCLEVTLPIGVSNAFQGSAAQVDLTLVAEQATEGLE